MAEKVYERVSEQVGGRIAKETADVVIGAVKPLIEKFEKVGFRKEDVIPWVHEGIDDANDAV